jgi:hypothetical protein
MRGFIAFISRDPGAANTAAGSSEAKGCERADLRTRRNCRRNQVHDSGHCSSQYLAYA